MPPLVEHRVLLHRAVSAGLMLGRVARLAPWLVEAARRSDVVTVKCPYCAPAFLGHTSRESLA